MAGGVEAAGSSSLHLHVVKVKEAASSPAARAKKSFRYKVYAAGDQQACVLGVATEGRSSRLIAFFDPSPDPRGPEVMWAKSMLPDQRTFELVNMASGQRIMNIDVLPRHLVVSGYYHPALLLAPARWVEAENPGGGGGGVQIVCVSANVNEQKNPLLPLKIDEWGGNDDGQMVLEAEEHHGAPSEEEEEEQEEDGGAEEATVPHASSQQQKITVLLPLCMPAL